MYRDQVRRYEEQIKREEQLRRENEASKTKKYGATRIFR